MGAQWPRLWPRPRYDYVIIIIAITFVNLDVMEGSFDVAVVGAGIEGSAIAHSLSSYNIRTVLLEQVKYI